MQEQQGNLEEPLSDLPGPRWDDPFKKGKRMKNNNNNKVDEIVAKTAEALGTGKAFGGWTDKVEQTVKQGPPIKIKLGKGRKIGSRVADIGPGGKEYNVKTDAEWDKQNKDKSGTMKGLMTPKQKGTKVGVLSHVETDGNLLNEGIRTENGVKKQDMDPSMRSEWPMHGMSKKGWDKLKAKQAAEKKKKKKLKDHVEYDDMGLDERHAPLPKSSEYAVHYPMGDNKQVTKLTKLGGVVDRTNKRVRFEFDSAAARTKFRNKNKKMLGGIKESVEEMDEVVATRPRQLKDKKKEMLVVDKKGKVSTIAKKDWNRYKKQGYGIAESKSIGGAIGRMNNENIKQLDEYLPLLGMAARGALMLGKSMLTKPGLAATGYMLGRKKSKPKTWENK